MPTRMIGSRSVDRIRAAVKSTANAVHMSAPAEEHRPSKKTLQQGSHPHMPLCFAVPSGRHAGVQWVDTEVEAELDQHTKMTASSGLSHLVNRLAPNPWRNGVVPACGQ